MAAAAPPEASTVRRLRRSLALALASLAGALLVGLVGWNLVTASGTTQSERRARPFFGWTVAAAGDWLGRLSYDLLFLLRPPVAVPPVRIVYLDERSAAALEQRGGVWDRALHTRLVQRLAQEGARGVFFDIVFPDPWQEPEIDAALAKAIQENGRVFLGAALELDYSAQALQERVIPPTPVLRRAAAGWGLIAFRPVDPDYGVRRLYAGPEHMPTATWRMAVHAGAPLPTEPEARTRERWLHYYGPANSFESVSYDRALSADELPRDFFRDHFVFVGGRSTLGTLALGKDDFRTPHGLFGEQFAKGVELHATTFLNLLRGDWLLRLSNRAELTIVLLAAALLGGGLPWLRPLAAAAVALLAVTALIFVAVWMHSARHEWFVWTVPALVQAPLALGWAVGARYFIEERRRRRLLDAFSLYLSPTMAQRISDADIDLRPGCKVVEATVMFTDMQDYTGLCDRMDRPESVAQVLTTYFTHTTGHILENDGTIIKYMGDAVQAVWGAPLADPDQARKAVLAAWKLHLASRIECEGHPLRTRIGLHRGSVLAGNLGSAQRFDYAVTGDPVNVASRLESLNKRLGTDILISEAVQAGLHGEFLTRPLGRFIVAGKNKAHGVHELLGPAENETPPPWLAPFADALAAFQRGDLHAAEQGMRGVIALRGGQDGPSAYYLDHIAYWSQHGLPPAWDGIIRLDSK